MYILHFSSSPDQFLSVYMRVTVSYNDVALHLNKECVLHILELTVHLKCDWLRKSVTNILKLYVFINDLQIFL